MVPLVFGIAGDLKIVIPDFGAITYSMLEFPPYSVPCLGLTTGVKKPIWIFNSHYSQDGDIGDMVDGIVWVLEDYYISSIHSTDGYSLGMGIELFTPLIYAQH